MALPAFPKALEGALRALIATHKMHVIWDSEWSRFDPNCDVIHVLPEGKACPFPLATLAHEIGHWTGHKSRLNRIINDIPRHAPEYQIEKWREEMAAEAIALAILAPYAGESMREHKAASLKNTFPSGLCWGREQVRASLHVAPAMALLFQQTTEGRE
jgi:antirestriction protein ArdC